MAAFQSHGTEGTPAGSHRCLGPSVPPLLRSSPRPPAGQHAVQRGNLPGSGCLEEDSRTSHVQGHMQRPAEPHMLTTAPRRPSASSLCRAASGSPSPGLDTLGLHVLRAREPEDRLQGASWPFPTSWEMKPSGGQAVGDPAGSQGGVPAAFRSLNSPTL